MQSDFFCRTQCKNRTDKTETGTRDNTPRVLLPSADGTTVYGNDSVIIDASHPEDGYIMISCTGNDARIKAQITGPDAITYTYDLESDSGYDTFPLSAGSGSYRVQVFENIAGDKYAVLFSQDLDVALKNEFTPFLYPNQFVNYNADTKAVEKGAELVKSASTDLDAVTGVYRFAVDNIAYDHAKAKSVKSGYLPDIDETLETKTGICFDYAALMTCMLRTQGIPTKLQIGYAGDIYHAWISCYLAETGWVDDMIHFDGEKWTMMDPTFAVDAKKDKKTKKFIENEKNYTVKYSR
ncbi:transglutaminase-like domain-containing protein [Ruminococcus sp. OA3]|uniref:transglutaminase-like domain-containing protein n=1 Tax=Ruminococcus sp. OA3 TaxID=2914164 RepID=UPI001F057FCF|nr:transglutaminase-like domain-containing protein [Ruminococcus sp. OA3]MCH1981837.1 transglutaminase-like domain-containing protein [Ruminococcus sp. OA3]